MFHDERYFDRPDEFNPERFLEHPFGGVEDDPARRPNSAVEKEFVLALPLPGHPWYVFRVDDSARCCIYIAGTEHGQLYMGI